MVDRVGQQLGNYRLTRLLGQGGFADVYLGEHVYLKNHAALKVLHTQLFEKDATSFVLEAQTLARLSHPHIVRVLDFAVQDGTPFLVMEYATGGTLRQRHPRGTRLSPGAIVPYVGQAASALHYAHSQHVIHRDVKPENMLLGARSEVLLSDFGLAVLMPHVHSHQYSTHNMVQQVAGTSSYLAPEQLRGRPQPASDQYALGVMVYEWLCGTPPFRGSSLEVAMQHISTPPPPLHEQVPDLLPGIEEAVLRALAKEPEQRFATVQDFADAFEDAYQPQPVSLSTSTSSVERPAPATTNQGTQSVVSPDPLWKVPTIFTSLIGREQDVATICTLLARPEIRLLTLLGTGGIGKTRLSLQVATEMRDHFVDGVCFVQLASIRDPELVMLTIAQELGIPVGTQPIIEQVKFALPDKHLLLVLDNFEQVVAAAPQVEELLAACPSLKIVATSREVLHLQVERIFPVAPLGLPNLQRFSEGVEGEVLSQYPAVALFVQRAQAILPTFRVTQANARPIAEICVHLDGLPLAIELAAARIKLLSPQALLARLSQPLQLLTGGVRTLPERQQTLRETLKWSYDLLDAQEQRLFRRLSVIVDSWTLEAAEAVGNMGDEINGGTLSTLDGVASLLDKSLLHIAQEEEEHRFRMLITVREFGLECLTSAGELKATRSVHARYYLSLAEEAEPHLREAESDKWFARLEQEHNNLSAALSWLLEQARMRAGGQEDGESAGQAMRLCSALYWFWYIRGYYREGRSFLEQALAVREGVAASVQIKVLYAAAELATTQDDFERAEALCRESLVLSQQLGETAYKANALFQLGFIAWASCHYALARTQLEEAVALFQALGDTWNRARSLVILARAYAAQGEYTRARELAEQNLVLSRALGNKGRMALALCELAHMRFLAQDDFAQAQALAEQSVATFQELGDRWSRAEVLLSFARVAASQGDLALARARYQESLAIACEIDAKNIIASALEGVAAMAAAQGEPRWAVRLWGTAQALRRAIDAPLPPVYRADYERSLAGARAHLGEKAFTSALAEGERLTPEQALAEAAQELATPPPFDKVERLTVLPRGHVSIYPAGLTAREVEVLRLVAQGYTDAQVAEQLVISLRTVTTHLTSIYNKLGVNSRAAATRFAVERHLV